GDLGVGGGDRQVDHDLHVGVVQHVLGGAGGGDAELRRPRRGGLGEQVAHDVHDEVRERGEVGEVLGGDGAGADEADADGAGRGLDALEQVPGVVVELDHAVGDVGGGPQWLGQGHRPGAEGELGGGVRGQVAVLEVDQLHALDEALEQGRHVGAADRGPV